MLYAIFCYDDEAVTCAWSKEKDDEVMASLGVVQAKLAEQGRLGPVARLLPTSAATTIRKGKEPIIMDGRFAETKEQLRSLLSRSRSRRGGVSERLPQGTRDLAAQRPATRARELAHRARA